jgi:hypothetical protein
VPRSARRKRLDRTNNVGLPTHVQRQLLQDIETAGGIGSGFSLRHICDSKEDIYGTASSSTRRSVRNKVYQWQKVLPRDEYNLLLATHGIRPHLLLQASQEVLSPVLNHMPSRASFASSTTEESSSSEESFESSGISQPLFPPTPPVSHSINMEDSKFQRDCLCVPFCRSCLTLSSPFVLLFPVAAPVPVHLVNLAQPEQNREFTIVLVNNIEMNGVLYNGISILFKGCRIFEYHDGMYSARIVSKTDIEVTYPSTAPGYLHEFGQVWDVQRQTGDFIEQVQQAHNVVRNAIIEDESRAVSRIILRFPHHFVLTAVPFGKVNNTELLPDVETVSRQEILVGTEFVRSTDYIMWLVGIEETKVRRAQEVTTPTTESRAAARLRERLARMSVSSSNASL